MSFLLQRASSSSCGTWAQQLWFVASLVVVCRLSCPAACRNLGSLTRDRTHIPCVGKQILNPWTARQVPQDVYFRKGSEGPWAVSSNDGRALHVGEALYHSEASGLRTKMAERIAYSHGIQRWPPLSLTAWSLGRNANPSLYPMSSDTYWSQPRAWQGNTLIR